MLRKYGFGRRGFLSSLKVFPCRDSVKLRRISRGI
jgi:hypothetical protein